MQKTPRAIAILSGGAPNSPLVTGALAAIYEGGKTFDVIFASGAGALAGMLFLAPKGQSAPQALRATLEVAIDDTIYNLFPLPYKTFFKTGPFAKPFVRAAHAFQISSSFIPPRTRRFYNDLVDLYFSAVTPTFTNFYSKSLCRPVPFIRGIVDFELLSSEKLRGRFYMNAYCIEKAEIVQFGNQELTIEHFHAALAFPFIYPPACVDGFHYYEGSSVDPVNFDLLEQPPVSAGPEDFLVLVDLLGAFESSLVRLPRNLVDAYGISIITPVCALARQARALYEARKDHLAIHCIQFDLPESVKPYQMDWSYSNMHTLWGIGYAAGRKFLAKHGSKLPNRDQVAISGWKPKNGG